MKIAIVAPCHIPPNEAWIHALKAEAADKATVIIVDDSNGKLGELPKEWIVLDYKKQEEFLGELYPEFDRMFHKSSACRVLGHLYAYKEGFDVIIGLDSDCVVKQNFLRDHQLLLGKNYGCGWFNPIGYPNYSRGYPYSKREWEVVGNMGLWENVLDINGKDRKWNEPKNVKIAGQTIPTGYFPFSGMNFALTRQALLYFLFLPNFDSGADKFRRIDDVWGGYIFQKFMQRFRKALSLGYPFVFHDTVVVPEEDAADEKAMYDYEDEFISLVDDTFHGLQLAYGENAAGHFQRFLDAWTDAVEHETTFDRLTPALEWWVKAIQKYA